jgi:hypothetical protein
MNARTRLLPSARALMLLTCLSAAAAQAHKPSDSQLALEVHEQRVTGRWDIAARDLDYVLDLDANRDGKLTWGEVRARTAQIDRYATERLAILASGEPCTLRVDDHLVDTHTDGAYVVLALTATCPRPVRMLELFYDLLFSVDPTHRGLLTMRWGSAARTAVFAPDRRSYTFTASRQDGWQVLASYAASGVQHIWSGFDHLLFLGSLLLPAVLWRRNGHWWPATGVRIVAIDVLATVTAFTLAHSITLSLGALGIVRLPSRWVESAIALSVAMAAANNLVGLVVARRWLFAFAFGLIHGLGFASALSDLPLTGAGRALALFGFNVGVEFGQAVVVAVLLPAIYAARHTVVYRRGVFLGGSCAIIVCAGIWLVERAFDLSLIPVH